jgi:hypothetical protein
MTTMRPPPVVHQILTLRDAVVSSSGATFNRWLFLHGGRWYYTLPTVCRRVHARLPSAVSLVMVWSDSFQHFVMDTLTKVRMELKVPRGGRPPSPHPHPHPSSCRHTCVRL